MKFIQTTQILDIPEGVTVSIKARLIKIVGPRGSLTKNLSHIDVSFEKVNQRQIKIIIHNGDRKHVAALRTVRSLVSNMVIGVTKGYRYKMRYVYAHFPININTVTKDGQEFVEIRNYLGEKQIREVKVREGVSVEISSTQKDELILTGNSVENVSQTCADIQQICRAKNKDIRKFLDGVYVSERGIIEDEY
ncbi:60S ribosomal protein uL6 [Ascoidea rubescens DSM 1968]|uniref:L8 n=1 Tax=Ascoidea rubescens DSM 1968 TaxID=1344418 RepID=A0A1D2VQX8_9ASCO|nr:ribosomal protein L6 [Ascoidea rubescens DSM 1968]ODV64000.1 ribosomal protein L6 [Ascoidea rubescens DSM 1968]